MFYGAPGIIHLRARLLRGRMTRPEKLMWNVLRNRKFLGYKFRRQHPINFYIADFYCHKLKLVIEIDGFYHTHVIQKNIDRIRDKYMEELGIMTIRFSNNSVQNELDEVLNILNCIINIRRSQ